MSWTPEVRCVLHRQGARKLNEGSASKANARRAARRLMAMIPGGPVPRDRPEDVDLPPGQHWVSKFPALPAGKYPKIGRASSLAVDLSGLRVATAMGAIAFVILSGITFGALTSRPLRRIS